MEFVQCLAKIHLFNKDHKGMKEISAKQYENRFNNLVKKTIYNYEEEIDENIIKILMRNK